MNRHLVILSKAFFTLAALAGAPALAGSAYFGWAAVKIWTAAPKSSPASAKSGDAAVDLLETAAHAAGSILGFLGGIADAVIVGLAIASLCVLAFAALLFFTGRGLRYRQTWARWLAFLLMIWLALVSSVSVLSAGRGPVSLVALALLAGSGYAMWVLLRRFAPAYAVSPPPGPDRLPTAV